jgi:hypothetical protein
MTNTARHNAPESSFHDLEFHCRVSYPHDQLFLFIDPSDQSQSRFNRCGVNTLHLSYAALNHSINTFFINNPSLYSSSIELYQNIAITAPFFLHNDTYIPVNKRMRYFVKDCFSAMSFNKIILLKRFADFLPMHEAQEINWNATWALLSYVNANYKASSTYFEQSSINIFSLKIFANELPFTDTLQRKRHPDLYSPNWLCPSCNLAHETWLHLWHCPSYSAIFKKILDSTKDALYNSLFSSENGPRYHAGTIRLSPTLQMHIHIHLNLYYEALYPLNYLLLSDYAFLTTKKPHLLSSHVSPKPVILSRKKFGNQDVT